VAIQKKSIHAETRSIAEGNSSAFSATPREILFWVKPEQARLWGLGWIHL